MKNLILIICFGLTTSLGFAQEKPNDVVVTKCSKFYNIPALRSIAGEPNYKTDNRVVNERKRSTTKYNNTGLPRGKDPVLQDKFGERFGGEPIMNFEGIKGSATPPDPSGAVGKDYYVHSVNSKYQVFDKEGKSAVGPFDLNKLWPGKKNSGDPIVMYDEFAERWFISQFQTGTNEILMAISKTEDPTGEYYGYEFKMDKFPDYPKYSIWSDAYYMTANSRSQNAVAFDREKMLAGDESATMIALNFPDMPTGANFGPLPADADGDLPPAGTPNYMFAFTDDGWSGGGKDAINIYKMKVDWKNPDQSSVTLHQTLETEPFDSKFDRNWDDIEQPGTDQRLDCLAGLFMYRVQYRRWVEYNTILLSQTVDVDDSNHAGIRWYELRDEDDGNWKIHQQSTYAPDDDSRWFGSIAMDKHGNIALGFSISGNSTYPGLRYTGRLKNDKLGEMTIKEISAIEGKGSQSGTNRFGDYSQMSIDPNNGDEFWYTGEYLESGGSKKTRIFSFKIHDGTIDVNENLNESLKVNVSQPNKTTLKVDVKNLANNESNVVQLFNLKGQLLISNKVNPVDKSFSHQFNVTKLASGSYFVRIGNKSFQDVQKIMIQ